MADDDTPAGFLSRWSKRKADVREGRAVVDAADALAAQRASIGGVDVVNKPAQDIANQPVPTMEDVQHLNAESNFASFMSSKVAPEVKNAAMKKLFADPHFNVMDGLDIYIDDYGQPDPLPAGMLEQMTSIDGLNLFHDKDKGETTTGQPEEKASLDVAQSHPSDNLPITQRDIPAHDHADLRLQPNPTARPEGTEPKSE